MDYIKSIRNVGIVANIDAGKTTTTEHILYKSGKIKKLGNVDDGTAKTDYLAVERERGISVVAAATSFDWENCTINLIDTPGHIDFAFEVERSLRILDGAILIISAPDGVTPHTTVLFDALQKMKIPTLIFVNKMDMLNFPVEYVVESIQENLTDKIIQMQKPIFENYEFKWAENILRNDVSDDLIDVLSKYDDELLQKYLNNEKIGMEYIDESLIKLVENSLIYPILFGSAQKDIGIKELMDAIVKYLPSPKGDISKPLSGVIFKVQRDKAMGKLSYVRIYDGQIRIRDLVHNFSQDKDEKVTQIRKINASSYSDIGILKAGDIAAVCGLDGHIGDILGTPSSVPPEHHIANSLLAVKIKPKNDDDYYKLVEVLQILDEEDPLLNFRWIKELKELQINIMGTIQVEVIRRMIQERFSINVEFDKPGVIYKETPSKIGYGFVSYTMPKPCWAVVKLLIEPSERGSGLSVKSIVSADKILPRYQNDVLRTLPEALQQGLYGWEVTDLKVTLVDGEDHVMHTHPQDFVVATPMAIMDGLFNTGVKLLEPILYFKITVPEEYAGKVINDLTQMRGVFDKTTIVKKNAVIEGEVPLSTSMDYPINLSIATKGHSQMITRFIRYDTCPDGFIAKRERIGVNPLDRAKYILSIRGAI
ncbi:MAG: elongation factor [Thermoanaerobacterium sp.]|nr:elongation factor [Thermoanaerobacterium sp.]